MTVNKRVTVRQVARRTSLTQRQAREAVDALIEIWREELVSGGKIAIDNFLILESKLIERSISPQMPMQTKTVRYYRLTVRASRVLRRQLKPPQL